MVGLAGIIHCGIIALALSLVTGAFCCVDFVLRVKKLEPENVRENEKESGNVAQS
jgi:hypothetical protein